MKTYKFLLLLLLFLLIKEPGFNLRAQGSFTEIGRWAYGIQEEMYFIDQIGYISCGANLLVTDFSDPLNPIEIDKITVQKFINHFILIDDHLYIGDARNMWVYNVSEPSSPQFIDSLNMDRQARQFYYDRNYLYQAAGDEIIVYDLAKPGEPVYLTTLDIDAGVDDLSFYGDYIYCTASNSEIDSLIIIDRSDLENPLQTRLKVTGEGYVNTSAVAGDNLFIGTGDSLLIMSLVDPAQPARMSSVFTGWVYDISLIDTIAFITRQGHGLELYNISDPLNPGFISRVPFWASKSKFRYPYVYTLGNGGGPIHIHDLTDLENPVRDVARISFGDAHTAFEVADNIGYLGQVSQLVILDLDDPAQIRQIGSMSLDNCSGLAISGDYCFLAERWSGWSVVDISNPEEPSLVVRVDTDDRVEDIQIRGHYAYLADWGGGIRIYDISDPENPVELGNYATDKDFQRLILVDSFIYAFERKLGLKVIDISDKANPVAVDSIAYPGFIESLAVHDTLVYLGMNGNNKILNVKDPAHPQEYDLTFFWQSVDDFAIANEMLYVAQGSRGLSLFDISTDPLEPILVSQYESAYHSSMVEPVNDNDLIYLVDDVAGIYVLRFESTTAINDAQKFQDNRLTIYPNPSWDYLNLSLAGHPKEKVMITIRNSHGKIFFSKNTIIEPGGQRIDIRQLPAGVYFLTVRNRNEMQTQKFIHLD